jgi:hypothetical protein
MISQDAEETLSVLVELTEANLRLQNERNGAFFKSVEKLNADFYAGMEKASNEAIGKSVNSRIDEFNKAASKAIKALNSGLFSAGAIGGLSALSVCLAGALAWIWIDNSAKDKQLSEIGFYLLSKEQQKATLSTCGKAKRPCIAVGEEKFESDGKIFQIPLGY